MKIILLKSVQKVGKKDEVLDVPEGYARNALFPKGLAIQATDAALAAMKTRLLGAQTKAALERSLLEKNYQTLTEKTIIISAAHTKEGVLFKKIHEKDIAQTIESSENITLDSSDLVLKEVPIKTVGIYTVRSKMFPHISFEISIE